MTDDAQLDPRVRTAAFRWLSERLKHRQAELKLERERMIMPKPPDVQGGALVIPGGLLRRIQGQQEAPGDGVDVEVRARVERLAMDAVLAAERAMGRVPKDVHLTKGIGYDIESRDEQTRDVFFIEVKGRGGRPGPIR